MPYTIGERELLRIKHTTVLEGVTFLRNKHKIKFFLKKFTFYGRKENIISSALAIRHTNHVFYRNSISIKRIMSVIVLFQKY